MSETKFTQGPWTAVFDGGDYVEIRGADDEYVLDIDHSLEDPLTEREIADIHLTEAGPEMYEAINRMLVHWLGDGLACPECDATAGNGRGCDTCYVVGKAIAALKKAVGEAS